MASERVTVADILVETLKAEHRIRRHTLTTPLLPSAYLSERTGAHVYLKLENEQYTGSFKARGSMNKVLALQEEGYKGGVVTASTGNHGRGIGRALQQAEMPGIVFLPTTASAEKERAIAQYGVQTKRYGEDSLSTELYAKAYALDNGMAYISPYNDPQIIGGQGTIGMEIAQQRANINAVYVTVGGGGLLSGIGTYMKAVEPHTKIIGCQPEHSCEMYLSIKEGKHVKPLGKPTLSDTSAGGVEDGSITYALCKTLVDSFVLVDEEKIAESIRLIAHEHHKMIEGAAAVAVASFLQNAHAHQGEQVAIVICGGNIDPHVLKEIL